jgi:hypothetical protein
VLTGKGAVPAVGGTKTSTAASAGLRVGEPNDAFEREADRTADEVMAGDGTGLPWLLSRVSMGTPLQRKCTCGGSAGAGGECEECNKKESLQRRAAGPGRPAAIPPVVKEVLRSPGQPLDGVTRRFMESRLGYDFGRVRVHTDATAAESARAVDALAYTVGRDLVFASGQYAPGTGAGRKLLAHELVHTVQQRAQNGRPLEISDPLSREELAAEDAAQRILDGSRVPTLLPGRSFLAREAAPKVKTAEEEGQQEGEEAKPKDVFAGAIVKEIVVDISRNRVGFFTSAGVARGNIKTDLKAGTYELKPEVEKQQWVIEKPQVKVGLRFDVDLEGALPWTMSYPESVPLIVGSAPPAGQGAGRPTDELGILRLLDDMAKIPGAPPGPPANTDDFESVHYQPLYKHEHGGWSKWLTAYYKAAIPQDINLDSITQATPRLWKAKQDVINWMNEDTFGFIVETFPTVYSIISITPLAELPIPTARPTAFSARRVVVKPGGGAGEEPPIAGGAGGRQSGEPPIAGGGGAAGEVGEPPSAAATRVKASGRTEPAPAENRAGSAKAAATKEEAATQGRAAMTSGGPWRGKPVIQNGNADEGWIHIDGRHVTGNAPDHGDLFAPGTTRAQLQEAAEVIVERGVRISVPNRRIQTFERRITINRQSDPVRVVVDTADGRVITMFPVRGGG